MPQAATNLRSISGRAILAGGLALAGVAICVALYLYAASLQSPQNYNRGLHDQSAYMGFAKAARETNFSFTGNRNRMPLYPFFQALFYSPEIADETYFQDGKWRNVALSLVCLLALGIALFRRFRPLYALYALLFIAFIVFVIKSPYFQAEILFYTLFGFAFIMSLDSIAEPSRHKPLLVGALFALAHLTKASAMPGILIFAASYCLPLLVLPLRRQLNRDSLRQLLYRALAPVGVFMIMLSPYFAESAARYTQPFYNVNTTFYMWFDSWDEAKAWSNAVGDRQGYPDAPADQIPSLGKYLREHTPQQVLDRLTSGYATIVESACYCKWCRYKYGYCSQVGLSLLLLAIGMATAVWLGLRRGVDKTSRASSGITQAQLAAFTIAFFVIYSASFAWYMPLIGKGPRTFLSLAVPLMWTMGLVLHAPRIQALRFRFGGREFQVVQVAFALMLLGLAYELFEVITIDAAIMDGGN